MAVVTDFMAEALSLAGQAMAAGEVGATPTTVNAAVSEAHAAAAIAAYLVSQALAARSSPKSARG